MTEQRWVGIHKTTEEAGELVQEIGIVLQTVGRLQQVIGKIGPFPDGNHPDGKGHLKERLEDEIGDLQAALAYLAVKNGLDLPRIENRRNFKIDRFNRWGLTGIPVDQEPQK